MKHIRTLIFLLLMAVFQVTAQKLTGTELLEKSIAYHDPNHNWPSFEAKLAITMTSPGQSERVSTIRLDLRKQYFQLESRKDSNTVKQTLNKGVCDLMLNGSTSISEEDKKTHRISCERAKMYKNYYTFLYGLPMKLNDPGTYIAPVVQRKKFKGKDYLVLKATYDKEVGDDIWYFYFDPKTYAMEVYQFFHEESKNDGEYILLSELEETPSGIKMPKTRAWYYNKDDSYLGTDVLTKASSL